MRQLLAFFTLIFVLSISCIAQNASIAGTIYNIDTSSPQPNVNVYLHQADSVVSAVASDSSGQFEFTIHNFGGYLLKFQHIDMYIPQQELTINADSTYHIDIQASNHFPYDSLYFNADSAKKDFNSKLIRLYVFDDPPVVLERYKWNSYKVIIESVGDMNSGKIAQSVRSYNHFMLEKLDSLGKKIGLPEKLKTEIKRIRE